MLDKDNQTQKASGSALAVQANRDVNIGMQYRDVKDLFMLLLENNFPKLKEEAIAESRRNVEAFSKEIFEKMSTDLKEDCMHALSSPSVQASINDSVMCVARKTDSVDTNMLSTLICDKVSAKKRIYRRSCAYRSNTCYR